MNELWQAQDDVFGLLDALRLAQDDIFGMLDRYLGCLVVIFVLLDTIFGLFDGNVGWLDVSFCLLDASFDKLRAYFDRLRMASFEIIARGSLGATLSQVGFIVWVRVGCRVWLLRLWQWLRGLRCKFGNPFFRLWWCRFRRFRHQG